MTKRIIILLLLPVLILTLMSTSHVHADEYWPEGISVDSGAAVVMDITNHVVLYEKNGDEAHYPASITKLMTALVAVENSEMDEVVTFSESAVYGVERGSSSIARDVGEQMTMEQCLYGMLMASANECAAAIAEHVGGGDADRFIDMMNQKAVDLGCTNTHFTNPHGLHDPNHYTTANDMAKIAAAAYQNPIIAKIVGTMHYEIPPTNKHTDPTPLNNQHAMYSANQTSRYLYEYCLGGKTGYTDQARNTLVTYAKKDNMLLVCVVLAAPGRQAEYQNTTDLLNYAFDNFTEYDLTDDTAAKTDLTGPLGRKAALVEIGTGSVVLPKTANLSDASTKVEAAPEDAAKNVAGRIVYTYAGHRIGETDLLYTEDASDKSPYPFHNIPAKDGGSDVPYIRIDFRFILSIVLIAAGIILAAVAIIHLVRARQKRHPKRAKLYKAPSKKYTVIRKTDRRRKS